MDLEEDTYSIIFTALKHPSRRKIIRILAEGPNTYTELQNKLGVETGFLNYYLESLDGLIKKDESKYSISGLGESALTLIKNVEESSPRVKSRDWTILGFRFNVAHISIAIVAMLILSNTYWAYAFQIQNRDRTNSLGNSILYSKTLLDESIDIINMTIRENRIFFHNWNIIFKDLLQVSNQFDSMKILDASHTNHWSQIALATGSLAEFFSDASERYAYPNYPYLNITIGQGWDILLPMLMSDLLEIERSLPTNIVLGNNPNVEIVDEFLIKALEAAFQLQRDIAFARRALNFPETHMEIYS